MTSTAGSWVPSPSRGAPRGSSRRAAAAQRAMALAAGADGLGASRGPAPILARMGGGRAPELRSGAVLVVAWVLLWAFFVLAVPAARLHAGAGSAAGNGAGEAAMARTATWRG